MTVSAVVLAPNDKQTIGFNDGTHGVGLDIDLPVNVNGSDTSVPASSNVMPLTVIHYIPGCGVVVPGNPPNGLNVFRCSITANLPTPVVFAFLGDE